jgi:hypothetical protein
MKTSRPIADVSPSKYTNPAVFDRRAEGYYLNNVTLRRCRLHLVSF